jgi:pyruvate dehydrogenase E2 component (dihydrolipoamide acetyltransferase)
MSVTRVILPKLGLTMDEGRLIAWHKKEGDRVEKGEVLFEVETDKANMEIEAPVSGVVRKILLAVDATAPVTTLIALIADTADEPLPAMAEVTAVRGTGPGGRINIEDVEAAAAPAARPAASTGNGTPEKREPLTRMRRAVAEAMTRSVREAPQFSISRDVDMTAANAKRKAAGVSYTDVIVSAAATALRAHPRLRSRYDGDGVVVSEKIGVGLAVALDAGLIVPVLRDADRKPLAALRDEREALEAAVRSGHARGDAFGGAAITVSNLGTFGVDRFTAIVNPPEASILAVGRVSDRVVAVDGVPAVRPVVSLTLTVDHRVADGADAARYLHDIAKALETS